MMNEDSTGRWLNCSLDRVSLPRYYTVQGLMDKHIRTTTLIQVNVFKCTNYNILETPTSHLEFEMLRFSCY